MAKKQDKYQEIKRIVMRLKVVTTRLEALNEDVPITTSDSHDAIFWDLVNLSRDFRIICTGKPDA